LVTDTGCEDCRERERTPSGGREKYDEKGKERRRFFSTSEEMKDVGVTGENVYISWTMQWTCGADCESGFKRKERYRCEKIKQPERDMVGSASRTNETCWG